MNRRRTDIFVAWCSFIIFAFLALGIFMGEAIPNQSLLWTAAGTITAEVAVLALLTAIAITIPWSDGDGG